MSTKYTIALFLFFIFHKGLTQNAKIWDQFISGKANPQIPLLPDYSYAGYQLGERALPEFHDLDTFNVVDFGAIPDDGLSDQTAIQKAIDAAALNQGGLIYFPSGEFDVMTNPHKTSSITISSSRIVLHGSGATAGGTVLNMRNHMLLPKKCKSWETPPLFHFKGAAGQTLTTLSATANRGDHKIRVKDASSLVGRKYLKITIENSRLVAQDFLESKKTRSLWKDLNTNGVDLVEYHEIVSIDLDRHEVTLRDPIVDTLRIEYGGKISSPQFLENCGFEDIHIKAGFKETFQHHLNYIHDYGWHAVVMSHVAHSWVTRTRFSNVTLATRMGAAYASSMMMLRIDGNSAHALTAINAGSTRTLQGLIEDKTDQGQWHGADISGRACGSVTWRVIAPQSRGWDLHASSPRTNLIDLYESKGVSGQGGNIKNLPHHLPGLTLWNLKRNGDTPQTVVMWPDCPDIYCGLTIVNPIIVGYHGATTTFLDSELKYQERIGHKVTPESLYEAQLENRLGKRSWLDKTLLAWQKLKDLWDAEP